MDKTLFEELVGSLKEAKAIAKGRAKPSRRFEITAPDAKAAALLKIVATAPEVALKSLHG